MSKKSPIVPCIVYEDAPAAIDWLCSTFGFAAKMVVPGAKEGQVAHAQLTLDSGMVMLSSARQEGSGLRDSLRAPDGPAGAVTHCMHITVDDCDSHCERARAAGADILMEAADQEYGGRAYVCRDPWGQIWSFGTYDHWLD